MPSAKPGPLYFLKRDLEGILVDDSLPFFRSDNPSDLSPVGYSGPALQTPDDHGDALFFFSKQNTGAQDNTGAKSDVCAIGYYPVYDNDNLSLQGIHKSYRLLRYFKSSDETWSLPGASHPTGLNFFLASLTTGAPDYTLLFAPALGSAEGDEVIARNIINFKVVPLDRDYQPLGPTSGNRFNTRPAFFEISLTSLNLETARKLNSQDDWHKSPPGYDNSILFRQNAQEFKLRVAVLK